MEDASLTQLAHRVALTDLISTYAHAVDAHDVDAAVGCFTADAHVDFDGGAVSVEGRDGLTEFFANAFAGPRIGPTGVSTHLLTNSMVRLAGDTAHLETQAVAYHANGERDTVIVRGLRYTDTCVVDEGTWRIRNRVHRSLWQAEVPGGPLSHPAISSTGGDVGRR